MKHTIYLGSDHAGFALKETIKQWLLTHDYPVEDCGAFELDPADDYPDFVAAAARKVATREGAMGLVFGKSGAGECIVANKITGIRAVLAMNEENVRLSREHNDANVLSLGAAFLSDEQAVTLCQLFLDTPFSREARHARRIAKIHDLESTHGE